VRTYDAINSVSSRIIGDLICEAILIKGSIGRGDDDEFSDVDMYVVVSENRKEEFLEKRLDYLKYYLPIIYHEEVNFVAEQIVAIYENGLHIDLYTVTPDTLPHKDKIKVVYDPRNILLDYKANIQVISTKELAGHFNDALYTFIEVEAAYHRENYVWVSRLLSHMLANCSILLRYLYDKDNPNLGFKKINEIIPKEQYNHLEIISNNLNRAGYKLAINELIMVLDFIVDNIEDDTKINFHLEYYDWIKCKLKKYKVIS